MAKELESGLRHVAEQIQKIFLGTIAEPCGTS